MSYFWLNLIISYYTNKIFIKIFVPSVSLSITQLAPSTYDLPITPHVLQMINTCNHDTLMGSQNSLIHLWPLSLFIVMVGISFIDRLISNQANTFQASLTSLLIAIISLSPSIITISPSRVSITYNLFNQCYILL